MNKKNKIIMAVLIVIAVIICAGVTSYAVKTVNENKKAETTTESTTTEPSTENTTEATTEPTTAPTTAQTTAKTTVAPAVPNSVVTTPEATTEQTTASTTEGPKYATMEQYDKIQKGVTTYEEACEIFGFEGTELAKNPGAQNPDPNCVEYMWATETGRFRIAFINNVVGTGLFDKMINQ